MGERSPGAPRDAFARLERAVDRLRRGEFREGWADYEARWEVESFVAGARGVVSRPMIPELARGPSSAGLAARRILLVGEQGLGDQIMFASMIPDLAAVAARVIFVCDPRLVRLFSSSFAGVEVLNPREAQVDTEAVDRVVAVGSLGGAFRPDAAAFPGTPYLRPRAATLARWAARLGARSGLRRVGLAWEGGLPTTGGRERSLALQQLAPVLDLPGCEFVSLQHGPVEDVLAEANRGRANPIRSFPSQDFADFDDLAGLVSQLDAVVSVQTALVHLCGGLGKPCLALIGNAANWRYMAQGETLPWYRSVRLFRQAQAGDWAPVVQQAADALAAG